MDQQIIDEIFKWSAPPLLTGITILASYIWRSTLKEFRNKFSILEKEIEEKEKEEKEEREKTFNRHDKNIDDLYSKINQNLSCLTKKINENNTDIESLKGEIKTINERIDGRNQLCNERHQTILEKINKK